MRVAAECRGTYLTHIRNESHAVLDAIHEAITIGERTGVPLHIYRLKAAGEENWPLMVEALALIDSVRTVGMDVTADIYPYIRNGIGPGSFLHPRHYAEGIGYVFVNGVLSSTMACSSTYLPVGC
ncbi:MAG: hypothetical protein OSA81_02860 [Longimicrobiales bacterium]|nr:hypothetical protein [Longimicrobiales bacterium]